MGFKTIDRLAREFSITVNRAKFKGLIGEGRIGSEKVILLKPQTYMNLSGKSVREIMDYYKVPEENLIVIYDLNSRKFPRVRIGIGSSEGETIQFVIGKVSKDEQQILTVTTQAAADAVADIVRIGIDNAMNIHNTRKSKDDH